MEFCICDVGGSGIRIKEFTKKGKNISQNNEETEYKIEFDKYITNFDNNNIYLKNSTKIKKIFNNIRTCYIGATAGVRAVVKPPKEYNVFMNNKFSLALIS